MFFFPFEDLTSCRTCLHLPTQPYRVQRIIGVALGDFGARERRVLHVCAQKPAQTTVITLVVPATVA